MNSKEIAKIAGVSRSTVSRVINNYDNVPEETKEKVMQIIEKYGYIPNDSARVLAGKFSKTIGLFITDFHSKNVKFVVQESGYFSEFISSIVDEVNKLGYNLLITILNNDEGLKRVKGLFINKIIAGGIFIGQRSHFLLIDELITQGYTVGVIDQEQNEKTKNAILVNSDNFKGGYAATEYLIKNGHKQILHICGDLKKYAGESRLRGYKQALIDYNIKINDELILYGDFSKDSGSELTKIYYTKKKLRPSAIFASSDSMAIGSIEILQGFGYKIPQDISIIGYDNIFLAAHVVPRLTTIEASISQISKVMVENIIKSIENKSGVNYKNKVDVRLIVRDSVLPFKIRKERL